MICIIAGNYEEAWRYARSQFWEKSEWFYPADEDELKTRECFHVIVVGTAGHNVPSSWFDRFHELARQRGRMNRK